MGAGARRKKKPDRVRLIIEMTNCTLSTPLLMGMCWLAGASIPIPGLHWAR